MTSTAMESRMAAPCALYQPLPLVGRHIQNPSSPVDASASSSSSSFPALPFSTAFSTSVPLLLKRRAFAKGRDYTTLSTLKLSSRCKTIQPRAASDGFSSPKTGSVGTQRFKDGALPGTYWDDRLNLGEDVLVSFNTGSKNVTINCKTGDNLLKVAEGCGVMIPTRDFCFEGSCYHCEMEVEGGANEVGHRADPEGSDLIRSCICPVPKGRQNVLINVWSNEDDGQSDFA